MRIEKYTYQTKKTLPVFMLVGVFLLVGLILRLSITLFYAPEKQFSESLNGTQTKQESVKKKLKVHRPQPRQLKEKMSKVSKKNNPTGTVFDTLHTQYPGYKNRTETLEHQKIPYALHNPVIGDARALVTFTIFTDPSCASCRNILANFLKEIQPRKEKISLVFKFMPTDKEKSDGGIFDQVAWRANVYQNYMKEINKKRQNLNDEDFLTALEKVGVPLEKQQDIMRKDMTEIITANQEDVLLSEKLKLYEKGHIPVIFINQYRLGQAYLPENNVLTYIDRLLKNEAILPELKE